jgi:hypothetical protein
MTKMISESDDFRIKLVNRKRVVTFRTFFRAKSVVDIGVDIAHALGGSER